MLGKALTTAAAGSAAGAGEATYVEDVFSTYLYTGNGSAQTIENSIALSDANSGGSVEFDGTGDWLTASADVAFGTGDFTLECWVYIVDSGSGYKGILSCFTSNIGPVIELYNGN